MEENDLQDLESIFAQVEDPRMERTKRHHLRDILILAICGVICGAEGWVEIEEFGEVERLASSWDGTNRATHCSRGQPGNAVLFAEFLLGADLCLHCLKPLGN